MSIVKPAFSLPIAPLAADLDKVAASIDKVKAKDGSVDLGKLVTEAMNSGNQAVVDVVQAIEFHGPFGITKTAPQTGSCGGGTTTYTSPPSKLDAAQVQTVREALIAAKAELAHADAVEHADGQLSFHEAEAVQYNANVKLGQKLASTTIDPAVKRYRSELSVWASAVAEIVGKQQARVELESAISRKAQFHAATPHGSEAIAWAYRALATSGATVAPDQIENALQGAESAFLGHLPLFGSSTKKGHLSDEEVGTLLHARDLGQLITECKAKTAKNLGGRDYFKDFLPGKDLAGLVQAQDPDYASAAPHVSTPSNGSC